jgi:mono/diheme cytochrome c family protein
MNLRSFLSTSNSVIRRAYANNNKNAGITLSSLVIFALNILVMLYAVGVSVTLFGIQRISRMIIVAVTPLLMAAIWMDAQPSPKPYRTPALLSPAGSVPVTGTEIGAPDTGLPNPVAATGSSLAEGKTLFSINCAMCHGQNSAERGPVGKKLKPPPPGLDHNLLKSRSDTHIFKAVTFGFGRMPPFKDKLTQEQRWHLVNFLRTRE